MSSFCGMGMHLRVNSKDREHRKKSILWACCVSLVLVVTAAVYLTSRPEGAKKLAASHHFHEVSRAIAETSSSTIVSTCKNTLYPTACESALASAAGAPAKSPKELFDISVQFAMVRAHSAHAMTQKLTPSFGKPGSGRPTALEDCLELLDITLEQLSDVLDMTKSSSFDDITTWLSAALTNQATCSEGLQSDVKPSAAKDLVNMQVQSLMQFISNSLALHKLLEDGGASTAKIDGGRKLLSHGFPGWLSASDRKLLEASPEDIQADAVVAQDGSGTHRTINEAIAFVSLASSGGGGGGRSVIYVKAGTYKEYVKIPKKQKNVMIMGDGKGKSVIVGNRNSADGWSTYQSATVAAMGAGFIAKGLTIVNTAGPSKQQAVALRVGADRSVVTQCSIQGYQDTLYTHSNRQFYRDNNIYGTVDFIFGNSAVVLQNCFIQPRRPNGGQKNSVTAQGRIDPNQNTGISIQNCKIVGSSDLRGTPTYLGRPWHKYSRVVVMESYLDGSINSAGWEEWSGSFALSTLYYGEYGNTGPGASTSGRVRWPGVHPSLSAAEASKFTVAKFIFGDEWLPATGVEYNAGL